MNYNFIGNIQSFYSDLSIEDFGLLILKQSVKMLKFAEYEGKIILARNGHLLGCAFHPELTGYSRILEYFVSYGMTCKICFHIVQYG